MSAGDAGAAASAVASVPRIRPAVGPAARAAAALALGAAAPLALAPVHLLPALLLSFGGLFLLLRTTESVRGAFGLGWLFGLGSFAVGLSWVTEAFSVDAERFGALALPALAALAGGLALFPAASAAAARALAPDGGWRFLAAFAAAWAGGEWLRGLLLTGFPWNLAGYAWGFADAPLQLASAIGIHGLGLLTVAAAALPALALATRRPAPLLLSAGLVGAIWIFGLLRLSSPPPPDVAGVRLRLIQPDVAQSLKWAPEERERILARLVTMTRAPGSGSGPPTVVVWPETAVPYLVAEQPEVRAAMVSALPPGAALVTGAVRRSPDFDRRPAMLNSILALDGAGQLFGDYDKIRLVPFGEYVPWRWLLGRFPKLTVGSVDFIPGSPRAAMPVPGAPPAWPLVCYEAIFPHALPEGGTRPGWILTVTNDAWFGTSWGPRQHALAARLRSVELGLPLVRAANSGVSLVTDGYGRVRDSLALGTRGLLDAALPGAVQGGTLYARLGDSTFLVLLVGCMAAARFPRREQRA